MNNLQLDQQKVAPDTGRAPCLLIHGLTAAPAQWAIQRQVLQEAGFAVQVPTLAGHEGQPTDLDPVRWQDWYADVLRAASCAAQPVNYAGLSLGGLLGLQLAIDRPDLVRRLVVIGTPLVLPRWVECLFGLINYTPLRWMVRAWPKDYRYAVAEPEGRARYQALGYPVFPLAAARQLKLLQRHVRRNLHRITTPLTVVHSRKDRTALPAGVALLQQHVRAPVTVRWLDYSYHVVTLDYDRDWLGELLLKEFA